MKIVDVIKDLTEILGHYGNIKVKLAILTAEGDIDFDITGLEVYKNEVSLECEPTNKEIDKIYKLKEIPEEDE